MSDMECNNRFVAEVPARTSIRLFGSCAARRSLRSKGSGDADIALTVRRETS